MKHKLSTGIVIGVLLALVVEVGAIPIRMVVLPEGTNQVELRFGPVVPGVNYGVMVRTNDAQGHWITFGPGFIGTSNKTISAVCNLGGNDDLKGLTVGSLNNWTFVAGSWEDPYGSGLPSIWTELALRADPFSGADPYADPMHDGWGNLSKLQKNMDPLACYPPPEPRFQVAFHEGTNHSRHGDAILTWELNGGPVPDYFDIERASRFLRRVTNNAGFPRVMTNRVTGRVVTNYMRWRPPIRPNENPFVLGPTNFIARVPGQPGVNNYRYVDTNVDTFLQAGYRLRAHNTPPLHARLSRLDSAAIRATMLSITVQPTTNGYALIARDPIPYAWYLLLVRDKNDPQWRASGYFSSGTNRDPVLLQVDKKGMMTSGQSPIAMPEAKYLADVVEPEFTAGWGEDSDGDGLPDIYEVLVTKTDPLKTDTGNIGIIDGFKELGGDGWSALDKFNRRVDPLKHVNPPPPVVLSQPTIGEAQNALSFRSELPYEPRVEIRFPGTTRFQVIHQAFWVLHHLSDPKDWLHVRGCFDLRMSWVVPEAQPRERENDASAWSRVGFALIGSESFVDRRNGARNGTNHPAASREEIEAYAATNRLFEPAMDYFLATIDGRQPDQPPEGLTVEDVSDAVVKIFPGAHTLLDQPIAFYGKVVDENGQPVSGATAHFEWTGVLVHGRNAAETASDAAGLFSFTNSIGTELWVSVERSNYYSLRRNNDNHFFNYTDRPEQSRAAFRQDADHPVIYYLQKKGVGARSLITSQYGVYSDFSSKIPLDGTPVHVDLLERKTGSGPLEISQIKPEHANWRTQTNWSFKMKILDGGFVSGGDEEFPFHPPESGYQPEVNFNFEKGQTNWTAAIQKHYYFRFGNPPLYGRIQVDTSLSDSSVRLNYTINPDGMRNLEPPNENTPPPQASPPAKAPAPAPVAQQLAKPKVAFTNASGQVITWGSMVLPFVKPGTRFIAVAAGGEHSLAVKADGTVVAWGRNISGEANVPRGLSNVVAVAAGGRSGTGFSVALRRDGTVVAWGDYSAGQTNVPSELSNVIAISAGTDHCLALKKDGTVIGWGFNENGKTQAPSGLSNVVAVAAGAEHSLALKRDGTIVAWGRNQWGQATMPEGLSNVISICSGSYFGLALKKDGSVVGLGHSFSNETDIPKDLTNVTAIIAGPWNGLVLRQDGTVTEWGRDVFFAPDVPPGLSNVVAVSCGGSDHADHTLALKADGTIVGWGNNSYGQSLIPGGLTNVISISGGEDHYLALRSDGSVVSLGGGEHQGYGQTAVPTDLGPVKQVAAGWTRNAVTRLDESVAGWGEHSFGLAGLVGNLTNVTEVALTYNDTLALRADGSVVVWGYSPAAPTQIFTNAIAIAGATHHALVLKQDGTVSTWGADGVLAKDAPTKLTDAIAIGAAGEYAGDHDLALKRDGTVVSWGINNAGQTNVPEDLTNVIAIAAGGAHSLALRGDGMVVAWGANNSGQCAVPEGLSNVIAIAAGGSSSAAVVFIPPSGPTFASALASHWTWVLVFVVLLIIASGFFWRFGRRRMTASRDFNA